MADNTVDDCGPRGFDTEQPLLRVNPTKQIVQPCGAAAAESGPHGAWCGAHRGFAPRPTAKPPSEGPAQAAPEAGLTSYTSIPAMGWKSQVDAPEKCRSIVCDGRTFRRDQSAGGWAWVCYFCGLWHYDGAAKPEALDPYTSRPASKTSILVYRNGTEREVPFAPCAHHEESDGRGGVRRFTLTRERPGGQRVYLENAATASPLEMVEANMAKPPEYAWSPNDWQRYVWPGSPTANGEICAVLNCGNTSDLSKRADGFAFCGAHSAQGLRLKCSVEYEYDPVGIGQTDRKCAALGCHKARAECEARLDGFAFCPAHREQGFALKRGSAPRPDAERARPHCNSPTCRAPIADGQDVVLVGGWVYCADCGSKAARMTVTHDPPLRYTGVSTPAEGPQTDWRATGLIVAQSEHIFEGTTVESVYRDGAWRVLSVSGPATCAAFLGQPEAPAMATDLRDMPFNVPCPRCAGPDIACMNMTRGIPKVLACGGCGFYLNYAELLEYKRGVLSIAAVLANTLAREPERSLDGSYARKAVTTTDGALKGTPITLGTGAATGSGTVFYSDADTPATGAPPPSAARSKVVNPRYPEGCPSRYGQPCDGGSPGGWCPAWGAPAEHPPLDGPAALYAKATADLKAMIAAGKDEGAEGDALRDRMDGMWNAMTREERVAFRNGQRIAPPVYGPSLLSLLASALRPWRWFARRSAPKAPSAEPAWKQHVDAIRALHDEATGMNEIARGAAPAPANPAQAGPITRVRTEPVTLCTQPGCTRVAEYHSALGDPAAMWRLCRECARKKYLAPAARGRWARRLVPSKAALRAACAGALTAGACWAAWVYAPGACGVVVEVVGAALSAVLP